MKKSKKIKKLKKEFAALGDAVVNRTARHAALETEWREEVRTLEDEIRIRDRDIMRLEAVIRDHFSPSQADNLINKSTGLTQCLHEWIDMRNANVDSGEWCPKCGRVRAGNK